MQQQRCSSCSSSGGPHYTCRAAATPGEWTCNARFRSDSYALLFSFLSNSNSSNCHVTAPGLVVRPSTSDPGSPVRVLVADSPSQSEDDVRTSRDVVDHQPLSRHAPLCSPETSFDAGSEVPSGRTSPATTSISTFQVLITDK